MDQNDNERSHLNQVYQAYGLALSWAQLFEAEVVNALICHDAARNRFKVRSQLEAFIRRSEKEPLRRRIEKMLKKVKFEPDLGPTFVEAIEKRNFLAHKYFWDRDAELSTEEGRNKALDELRGLTELFYSAHKFASLVTDLYADQIDGFQELMRREIDRLPD